MTDFISCWKPEPPHNDISTLLWPVLLFFLKTIKIKKWHRNCPSLRFATCCFCTVHPVTFWGNFAADIAWYVFSPVHCRENQANWKTPQDHFFMYTELNWMAHSNKQSEPSLFPKVSKYTLLYTLSITIHTQTKHFRS